MASAKLWAVYISEAEKYDKAMVERWRTDMEGLLIFVSVTWVKGEHRFTSSTRRVSSPRV
jgi:uncharacterized membrane protein